VIGDEEADRRFAELSRQAFGESVMPLVFAELQAGNHERAQRLMDADDAEKRLREAPREALGS
jgi:hypothetical protein